MRKDQRTRARTILLLSTALALHQALWLASPALAQARDTAPDARPRAGFLVPSADAAPGVVLSGMALAYPASGGASVMLPLGTRMTAILGGLLAGYPPGAGGAAALRIHLRHTDVERWGLAVQAQTMGAVVFLFGEGAGGTSCSLALVASSPIRPARIHLGVALHTMPGSEYEPGWEQSRDYGFDNPQVAAFVAGERTGRRLGIFAEALWAGIGADDGWDSTLASLLGGRLYLGRRTALDVGVGVILTRFGSGRTDVAPLPPLARLSVRL